ncbi:hypothetical protein ACPB9E_01925 [Streptomyces exfoliatus]|uniref:hypothetical protein n=1 Tax=Streptomyces exfoliatus TaxID=1905 RepID=UPI003C2BEACA
MVLALIPMVVAHERVGVFTALGRTVDLLKGGWWWSFLNLVLATTTKTLRPRSGSAGERSVPGELVL